MPRCYAVKDRFLRKGQRSFHPEWLNEPRTERDAKGFSSEDFDDPAQGDESRIAIGKHFAGREELGKSSAGRRVSSNGPISSAEVLEVVTIDAARVGEEVAHGNGRLGLRASEPRVGQVLLDWVVQVDRTLINQLHDECRRIDLGDRTDLKKAVGGGGNSGVEVEQAGCALSNVSAVKNRKDRPLQLCFDASSPSC